MNRARFDVGFTHIATALKMYCITIETKCLADMENLFRRKYKNKKTQEQDIIYFRIGQTNHNLLSIIGNIIALTNHDHRTELIRTDLLTVSTKKASLYSEFI